MNYLTLSTFQDWKKEGYQVSLGLQDGTWTLLFSDDICTQHKVHSDRLVKFYSTSVAIPVLLLISVVTLQLYFYLKDTMMH